MGFFKNFFIKQQRSSPVLCMLFQIPFFDEMFVIQDNIAHLIKSQNHLLKNMATKMEYKYDKYWRK